MDLDALIARKPAVALISASLARAVFPAGDEIGRHIRIAGPDRREVEVVGVVADAPYVKLDDPTPLVVFRPIMQETARTQFPMAYVRAKGDLATVRVRFKVPGTSDYREHAWDVPFTGNAVAVRDGESPERSRPAGAATSAAGLVGASAR